MKIINSIVLLSIGAAFGVGTVLSCSDNTPRRSDAATCDCPASEAPIAGRVVVIEGTPQTLQAGSQGVATAGCMPSMQFLSGTCTAIDPTVLEDITLQQAIFDKAISVWGCAFKNNKLTAVQIKATALCLKPPS